VIGITGALSGCSRICNGWTAEDGLTDLLKMYSHDPTLLFPSPTGTSARPRGRTIETTMGRATRSWFYNTAHRGLWLSPSACDKMGGMEEESYSAPRGNIAIDQIPALPAFMYRVAVHLETLEILVRARYSDEEYRQAYEQARQGFPSEAIFPQPRIREELQDIVRKP